MTFAKKTVRDVDPAGKRALTRVDFNVPVENGKVTDVTRITAALPTIRYLRENKGRVVLMSHLGRPKGGPEAKYSLAPVRAKLEELLGAPVKWANDCIGEEANAAAAALGDGDVLLLENLRFHPEEEKNDAAFAKQLAQLGDFYVNDAFGTAHRAHASTEGVARILRPAVSGLLMEKELEYLGRALDQPERPFVAILGGAKISGKIDVLEALLGKVNRLLIGGAMMFTFVRALSRSTGKSLVEEDKIEVARSVLDRAHARGVEVVLPHDLIVSRSPDGLQSSRVCALEHIAPDEMGVDIGPDTVKRFAESLADARTILWNGPMGVFEVREFAKGTIAVAHACAEATARGAITVVGGGDSVAAVQQAGLTDRFTHVSTGGGASLEFLEGKELPGVAALDDA